MNGAHKLSSNIMSVNANTLSGVVSKSKVSASTKAVYKKGCNNLSGRRSAVIFSNLYSESGCENPVPKQLCHDRR